LRHPFPREWQRRYKTGERDNKMGGFGSGRYHWYTKKTTVEDCYRISIKHFTGSLEPGCMGVTDFGHVNRVIGLITYRMEGDPLVAMRISYTMTINGERQDLRYPIFFTTTLTSWGSPRYWFICPLEGCGRRAGVLYLPPGCIYFGCRHCNDLTYKSCQEQHEGEGRYRRFAANMQDEFPGLTAADMHYVMENWGNRFSNKPPPRGGYFDRERKQARQALLDNWALEDDLEREKDDSYYKRMLDKLANPSHARALYLTASDLCEQSGLFPGDLTQLEAARLLLPDTKDGHYRPKLVSWGRKLAYLISQGWSIDEIHRWAKGRWSASDPRKWPPDRTGG
jgi:hypothetical protein